MPRRFCKKENKDTFKQINKNRDSLLADFGRVLKGILKVGKKSFQIEAWRWITEWWKAKYVGNIKTFDCTKITTSFCEV